MNTCPVLSEGMQARIGFLFPVGPASEEGNQGCE